MAWNPLPTNYTDAIWEGLKKYQQINNPDNTISFQDVTQYVNRENSFFGALDANRINEAVNMLMSLFDGTPTLPGEVIHRAGTHNSIYRGKRLGGTVTAEQYAAIQNGTFEDMYIGDYWEIGGIKYRIAAFDYYYLSTNGTSSITTHHVTLIPDSSMYSCAMNNTDTTSGGYVGSNLYQNGLDSAKSTINAAFGSSHILTHWQYLCNAVTNGKPSGGSWYDSTIELMTEQNCYGGRIYGAINDGLTVPKMYTKDKSQYPLFALQPFMISNGNTFWLRDIVSNTTFADVSIGGYADYFSASGQRGIRPSFSIKA